MNQRQFNVFSRKLNDALAPEILDTLGKQTGFCQRQRLLSPHQLFLCLVTTMACEKTETIADIQRRCVEWTQQDMTYRALYAQLSREAFPIFLRQALSQLLRQWIAPSQAFAQHSPYRRFTRVLIQDGSSFAVHNDLSTVYPGRFNAVNPAAVELHVTMDLLADQPCKIVLTPDTAGERDYLPPVESLKSDLILVDRGYFDLDWFARLSEAGGHCIARCLNGVNPTVEQAWSESGRPLRFAKGSQLKDIEHKLLKRKRTEVQVRWQLPGKRTFRARLIACWNPEEQRHSWLLTTLPREDFSVAEVSDGYRLRWQLELLFKEWKSYANLHRFNTVNPAIAEGLIWASIAAAVLKRFLCLNTQALVGHALSTRRVAMCAASTITQLMGHLIARRPKAVRATLRQLVEYLGNYARRANPKRDRKTGRAMLGLEAIGYA